MARSHLAGTLTQTDIPCSGSTTHKDICDLPALPKIVSLTVSPQVSQISPPMIEWEVLTDFERMIENT